MKKILLSLLIISVAFIGCKKDDDASLRGEWEISQTVYKYYINNRLDDTETEQGDGTRLDFQSGGRLVITDAFGDQTIADYSINGDEVEIDGVEFEIRNLTDDSATLYVKDDYGAGEYEELFIYLER